MTTQTAAAHIITPDATALRGAPGILIMTLADEGAKVVETVPYPHAVLTGEPHTDPMRVLSQLSNFGWWCPTQSVTEVQAGYYIATVERHIGHRDAGYRTVEREV